MTIFPQIVSYFTFKDSQTKTLDRLHRRTEKSELLIPKVTDKTFIGQINGNQFHLITSNIGFGGFCVLSGEVNQEEGYVRVEINKPLKILFTLVFFLPVLAAIIESINSTDDAYIFILVAIGQILMIRFIFIGIAFRFLSKLSLNKLREVLDFEWV